MSFSLNVAGHHNDPEVAEAIDEIVKSKGAEIVAEVNALDPSALSTASFSGPTGHVNLIGSAS